MSSQPKKSSQLGSTLNELEQALNAWEELSHAPPDDHPKQERARARPSDGDNQAHELLLKLKQQLEQF